MADYLELNLSNRLRLPAAACLEAAQANRNQTASEAKVRIKEAPCSEVHPQLNQLLLEALYSVRLLSQLLEDNQRQQPHYLDNQPSLQVCLGVCNLKLMQTHLCLESVHHHSKSILTRSALRLSLWL